MAKLKNSKKLFWGSVVTMTILMILTVVLSAVLSFLNVQGKVTSISNGVLETSLISINNALCVDGIKYFFGNIIANFVYAKPLLMLFISLMTVGILEKSGLLKILVDPLKKYKLGVITFLVILISIISTFLGEHGYILLLPLIGMIYKHLGRNPFAGIITVFLGITLGYGAGIIFNYNDLSLGKLTQIAATTQVDKSYYFRNFSTIFVMIISTGLISVLGSVVLSKRLFPKLPKVETEEVTYNTSRKALLFSMFSFIIMILIVIYLISPGLPGSGILLDNSGGRYLEKLFWQSAPFAEGFQFLILIIAAVCAGIYGFVSKNFRKINDLTDAMHYDFVNIGNTIVIVFFLSQLISLITYTNIGNVLAVQLVDFMGSMQFSGIFLILMLMIIVVIITIVIPGSIEKWQLLSPVIVPLFMRSNITPDFTQLIFTVSDGIGKAITPFFIYLVIMVGLLNKYNNDDSNQISVISTIKLMMPSVLIIAGIWLLIIVGWYVIGLPLGINTMPTM